MIEVKHKWCDYGSRRHRSDHILWIIVVSWMRVYNFFSRVCINQLYTENRFSFNGFQKLVWSLHSYHLLSLLTLLLHQETKEKLRQIGPLILGMLPSLLMVLITGSDPTSLSINEMSENYFAKAKRNIKWMGLGLEHVCSSLFLLADIPMMLEKWFFIVILNKVLVETAKVDGIGFREEDGNSWCHFWYQLREKR